MNYKINVKLSNIKEYVYSVFIYLKTSNNKTDKDKIKIYLSYIKNLLEVEINE